MTQNTRISPERIGRMATKFATEAAYVVAGLADVVAGTVKDVVNSGKQSYNERKAAGGSPVKDYAKGVPDQVKGLVGEVSDAVKDLSARGRTVLKDGFSDTAHRSSTDSTPPKPDFEQPPTS